ncbi:MAG: long-chain fatty acid--CoA ligase [Planctomycetaceae bacterium]
MTAPQPHVVGARDLSASTYLLEADWDVPRSLWHDSYPHGVPPGLRYAPARAERLLLGACAHYPRRIAVRYWGTAWSYEELVERVSRAAGNFRQLGVEAGDRVMMVLPNSPEFVVAWFALHWLGAEIVPANPLMCSAELAELVRTTGAQVVLGLDVRINPVARLTQRVPVRLVLVSSLARHLPWYLAVPYTLRCRLTRRPEFSSNTIVRSCRVLEDRNAPPVGDPVLTDADRPAVLQPTGGTTGTPKVAVLTHANLHANVAQLHVWSGCQPGTETVLAVLPFFHVFGATVAMLSPIAGGATLVLQAQFQPKRILSTMEQFRPNVAPMVPFMFASLNEAMAKRKRNVGGLDFCFSGASALSAEVREEFQERTGATIFEGYGLSEASPVTHANPPDSSARPGSVGLPLPCTEARVVDVENGVVPVAPGQVGELIVRGPQIMREYLDAREETELVLRDGWLHTGDLVTMDHSGFFTVVDRKKDMIISAGLNIYPAEVEEVLAAHPAVQECAVVGVPDKRYGERVAAYVVPVPGAKIDADALKAHCRTGLASYKIPRIIEIRSELPKNFLGKVRRIDLRKKAA